MAEQKSTGKQSSKENASGAQASQSAGSAVRHVGKTLESDPEYNDRPSRELAPEIGLIDPHGNDISASPNMYAGSDPLVGTELSQTGSGLRVEPLKTRLPGDTSSDPHTDVGPDNATNLQNRR